MSTNIDISNPNNEPLYEFSIYPFSTDLVFQEGLHSIVSSAQGRSQEELDNVIGQAKAFYFTRTTGNQVTWDIYVEWRKSHPSPFPSAPVDTPREVTPTPTDITVVGLRPSESPPLTFQQITELIRSGKTDLIPNNKVIPEALHVKIFLPCAFPRITDGGYALEPDPPSESSRPVRKKPWETSDQDVEAHRHAQA